MKRNIILSISVFILTLLLMGCNTPIDVNNEAGAVDQSAGLAKETAITITAEEKVGLTHMREEEKLARDVYTALFTKWNYRAFKNISQSEQAHMNAILTLLNRYSVPDPVINNETGKFSDPKFTALYDSLITRGNTSLDEALKVGVVIEKLDIADLTEQLTTVVKAADIQRVYTNLKAASVRHLKAFSSTMCLSSETY